MTDVRLSDLTIGTICRIGITLSTCFWLPVSLLLGIGGAIGALPIEGLHRDTRGVVGFVGGVLQGIGCSIAMDILLVLGALGLGVAQRVGGGGSFTLRLRRPDRAAGR